MLSDFLPFTTDVASQEGLLKLHSFMTFHLYHIHATTFHANVIISTFINCFEHLYELGRYGKKSSSKKMDPATLQVIFDYYGLKMTALEKKEHKEMRQGNESGMCKLRNEKKGSYCFPSFVLMYQSLE